MFFLFALTLMSSYATAAILQETNCSEVFNKCDEDNPVEEDENGHDDNFAEFDVCMRDNGCG
ncbi:hypothetical protein [Joostella sp. CR20]|uniref:hypothetical protein n=1 Tax=Joostella sp. CR20 TaxID=2804312 RepID=UPI00313C5181